MTTEKGEETENLYGEKVENGEENEKLYGEKVEHGHRLLHDLHDFSSRDIKGISKLKNRIKSELEFLGRKTSTVKQLQCTNLSHLSAIVDELKTCRNVVSVLQNFDFESKKVTVDVVSDFGRKWVKVFDRNPTALDSLELGLSGNFGQKSVSETAQMYVEMAEKYPFHFRPPQVKFQFHSGISENLARIVRNLGVEVQYSSIVATNFEFSSPPKVDEANLMHRKNEANFPLLNLDITAMIAYVSSLTNGFDHVQFKEPILNQQAAWERSNPVKPFIQSLFTQSSLICCRSALQDFQSIIETLAGPGEKDRAARLIESLAVVPDDSSDRVKSLKLAGKVRPRSVEIFGTADKLKAVTLTSNMGFVRAAANQNVPLAVIGHESRALTESKMPDNMLELATGSIENVFSMSTHENTPMSSPRDCKSDHMDRAKLPKRATAEMNDAKLDTHMSKCNPETTDCQKEIPNWPTDRHTIGQKESAASTKSFPELYPDVFCSANTNRTFSAKPIPAFFPVLSCPISYDAFFHSFMLPNTPCVIKDPSITRNWAAFKDWQTESGSFDPDYFPATLFRDCQLSVVPVADCDSRYFDSQKKMDMTVKDYFEWWKGDRKDLKLYLKDWHFVRDCPNKDYRAYTTPLYFGSDWLNEYWSELNARDDYKFVYVGPRDSWTPLHTDVYGSYSWSANVSGTKRWIFFPPGQASVLENVYNVFESLKIEGSVDNSDGRRKTVAFKGQTVTYYDLLQQPGHVLFVPSGWHHQVVNVTDAVSINHNWLNGCNVEYVLQMLNEAHGKVQQEIRDCLEADNVSEWRAMCQDLLRASHGMNHSDMLQMILSVVEKRIEFLQQYKHERNLSLVIDAFQLGPNHAKFDLVMAQRVLKGLVEDVFRFEESKEKVMAEDLVEKIQLLV